LTGLCPCEQKAEADRERDELAGRRQAKLGQLLRQSRLGERFESATFQNWSPVVGAQRAHDELKHYAATKGWERGEGALIYGPPGNGKSHLAAAIVHAALGQGAAAIFQSVPEMLARIRASYDGGAVTETDVLGALRDADLVVLDDLGAERLTEWAQEKIYQVVACRYEARRALIITTNLDAERELAERVGPRIFDRLLEMCVLVENSAPSYRRKIAAERMKEQG
jgi:DNA replication protein DnaC